MNYYCFIQARYSSKRLRGKVLKKFGKISLLEILLKRLKKSKKISKIIVLTSNSNQDKKIISLCKKNMSIFDIVYNPKKTLLCRYAKKLNFNFINGIKMNTVQAEIALKKIENYYKS